MSTFIERLIVEKIELEEKAENLHKYLSSGVNVQQRDLLEKQLKYMKAYLDVLLQRIEDLCNTLNKE